MATIPVTLPIELSTWRPTLFPGDTFLAPTCTCPTYQPWPGQLVFDSDCPVHTHAVRTGWTKFVGLKANGA